MADIIANNGIPMSIDGSIIGFLGIVVPPVETTVLETLTSLPSGVATSMSSSTNRLSQSFKMPQALSGDFTAYIYGEISGSPDFDIQASIVGVVGDVSTGTPYSAEILGTSSNIETLSGATPDGYMAFDFSGVTLQDASTYALVITPTSIVQILGWGWERSTGTVDLYPDGIAWFSSNSGTSWIYPHGDPEMDFGMKITHLV